MKKIIGYITTFWRRKEIYEQEYKWIPSFVQELGFTKISYTNHGLNQTFYHKNKDQKLFLGNVSNHYCKDLVFINFAKAKETRIQNVKGGGNKYTLLLLSSFSMSVILSLKVFTL